MRELSVAEQRYQAVLAVIKDGRTVTEVAAAVGVSRQTVHAWLGKYEAAGLKGLGDGSHRPPAGVECAGLGVRVVQQVPHRDTPSMKKLCAHKDGTASAIDEPVPRRARGKLALTARGAADGR